MKTTRDQPLVIYTDGSCQNYARKETRAKKGHGGWAFIVVQKDGENIYRHGHMPPPQTNNTAELQAVLEALRWIVAENLTRHWIMIRPDSTYVIDGMISGWRHLEAETNFRDVPNAKFWREMHALAELIPRLRFRHVKGHSGEKFNEMCDTIASNARRLGMLKYPARFVNGVDDEPEQNSRRRGPTRKRSDHSSRGDRSGEITRRRARGREHDAQD